MIVLANLVFEEAPIGEVDEFRIVDVKKKCWGVGIDLAGIKDFKPLARFEGRHMFIHRRADDAVELSGGDADQAFLLHAQGGGHHLLSALAGLGRDK